MAAYTITTDMATASSLFDNSSLPGGTENASAPLSDECVNVQYIPGVVSNATRQGLEEFSASYARLHGYVAIAVCVFGIFSNVANIIVLTRKNMASSTNTLLMWLAVSDLLTMLSYLPFALHFYVMKSLDPPPPEPFSSPYYFWIFFLMFHANFSILCHSIAIWLTIALAIFRYIYICKPTQGAYYCSQQRARYVVIIIIVLTVIILIPNYIVNTFETGLYKLVGDQSLNVSALNSTLEETNGTEYMVYYFPVLRKYTEFDVVMLEINYWVQAILVKLIPCGMLTTLTLLLLHAMHKAYRKRLKLKSQGRKAESDKHGEHNRTTGMLLAVVVLFTITELPQGILFLLNTFVKCFTQVVYYPLGDLLDIMALTNNSVNFFLYCTMSKQFRTTFATIFCPERPAGRKWLKLRLIKSSHNDGNSIEDNQKAKNNRSSLNGRADTARCSQDNCVEEKAFVKNELKYNDQTPERIPDVVQPVQGDHDKLPLTLEENNGTTTHTHGYSMEHSHV